jgi:hypothetical protein
MGRLLSAGSKDPGAALGVISPGGKGDLLPKLNWELPSEAERNMPQFPPNKKIARDSIERRAIGNCVFRMI